MTAEKVAETIIANVMSTAAAASVPGFPSFVNEFPTGDETASEMTGTGTASALSLREKLLERIGGGGKELREVLAGEWVDMVAVGGWTCC